MSRSVRVHWIGRRVDCTMSLVVGIDASRIRSGGGKAHLIGILSSLDPARHGILEIHVWSFQALLDSIPNRSWLVKHNPSALEKSLAKQLWWQTVHLSQEVKEAGCDILFTADASTLCRFRPMVVLSHDMLSYEPGVMRYFGYGYAGLRLLAIAYLQNAAFRRAEGVIFLTQYTAKVIQGSCGRIENYALIPHGISKEFMTIQPTTTWPLNGGRPIQCLYVSPIWLFKHQWVTVRAIEMLRAKGHDIVLTLAGDGDDDAKLRLSKQIATSDPTGVFVKLLGNVEHKAIPDLLANADMFIFASSCENMPNTVLEAMAAGLPIACSNRDPMPEILADGGIYFDPEDADSIAAAIEKIIANPELRLSIAKRAKVLSEQYSWLRCAEETFAFIAETYKSIKA